MVGEGARGGAQEPRAGRKDKGRARGRRAQNRLRTARNESEGQGAGGRVTLSRPPRASEKRRPRQKGRRGTGTKTGYSPNPGGGR